MLVQLFGKSTFSVAVAGRPFSILSANAKKMLGRLQRFLPPLSFFFGLVHHGFAVASFQSRPRLYFVIL